MFSFFSKSPAAGFNYEIGQQIENFGPLNGFIHWEIFDGNKKDETKTPVSIFTFDKKQNPNESTIQLLKTAITKSKTLRHPGFVNFIQDFDTPDKLYLITERIIPLKLQFKELTSASQRQEAASQGLFNIASSLAFMHKAELVHDNVCSAAVFVDRAGLWKLMGLEYVHKISDAAIYKTLTSLQRYDPPEINKNNKTKRVIIAGDTWRLGCLLWEAFKGDALPECNALGEITHIPSNLKKVYMQLVGANPTRRPTMEQFISQNNTHEGDLFYDSKIIKINKKLDNIQLAEDKSEKDRFIEELTNSLEILPERFCVYRVLPKLINLWKFGGCGAITLTPLLKIAKNLSSEEYNIQIIPVLVAAFSSSDRSTRVFLLKNADKYIDSISDSVINKSIYPPLCTGFSDTNPAVREQTVKSMLHIGPKLNNNNLNIDLMRHFARLQAKDDQAPIRCNTTICLGKLLTHLNKETKQKVMNSAFNRAMKDPFPPARQAGLAAILANADEYTLPDLAMKMLPGITPLLCDREKTVRNTALKAARMFLSKIEEASQDPLKEAELVGLPPGQVVQEGATSVSSGPLSSEASNKAAAAAKIAKEKASGWMNSAMSYASSYKKTSTNNTTSGVSSNSMSYNNTTQLNQPQNSPKPSPKVQKSNEILEPTKTSSWDDDDDDFNDAGDGWDDFNNDMYASNTPTPVAKSTSLNTDLASLSINKKSGPTVSSYQMQMTKNDMARAKNNLSTKAKSKSKEASIWDDFGNEEKKDDLINWGGNDNWDEFNSFEPIKPDQQVNKPNYSSANFNSLNDDSILKPTRNNKRAVKKPVKKKMNDDWGDW